MSRMTMRRVAELYKRLMILADKRQFNTAEVELLTALMLASAMLNAEQPEQRSAVVRRVLEQAKEFIDTNMLIARE